MAEGSCLLSSCGGNSTLGSNPSLSAINLRAVLIWDLIVSGCLWRILYSAPLGAVHVANPSPSANLYRARPQPGGNKAPPRKDKAFDL